MPSLAAVCSRRVVDGTIRRVLKTGAEVPDCAAAITPDWLTRVLCASHPRARVVGVELGNAVAGPVTGRAIRVAYNPAGSAAGLPVRLYAKSTETVLSQLIMGLGGLLPTECRFYSVLAPELDVETPTSYFAGYDERASRCFVLLEDVTASRGATFCGPESEIGPAQIEGMVEILAQVHGRFWQSPRLDGDLTWLRTPQEYQRRIASFIDMREQSSTGFDRALAVMPSALIQKRDRLWPAYERSLRLCAGGPATFLHGDSHVSNYYETATGAMGLCDWQVSLKGVWGLDFCYTLISALSVERRRGTERALLGRYLARLEAAGGPRLSFDDAWLVYRQQPLYALHAWLCTLGRRWYQPRLYSDEHCRHLIERLSSAVADLDSIGAVGG